MLQWLASLMVRPHWHHFHSLPQPPTDPVLDRGPFETRTLGEVAIVAPCLPWAIDRDNGAPASPRPEDAMRALRLTTLFR